MTDEFVFEIMEKFNSSDVVDLDFSRDGTHLSLKKKEACTAAEVKTVAASNTVKESAEHTKTVKAEPAVSEAKAEKKETKKVEAAAPAGEVLKCPIVGTFYRAPSPDSPAYAEKGKKIKKGEPLCIIEAMKMMNTLNAEYDLEVLDVLVENGELVEFDQPLFSIARM